MDVTLRRDLRPMRLERRWSPGDVRSLAANDGIDPAERLDAEAGWSLGAFGQRGVMMPFTGLALSQGGERTWRRSVGWRLGPDISFGLEGTRREPPMTRRPDTASSSEPQPAVAAQASRAVQSGGGAFRGVRRRRNGSGNGQAGGGYSLPDAETAGAPSVLMDRPASSCGEGPAVWRLREMWRSFRP